MKCPPAVLLHLLHSLLHLQSSKGQSLVVGPRQPIVAILDNNIILPCSLEPAVDASHLVLEWSRPDLNPGLVHVVKNEQEYLDFKNPSYKGRTSLSFDKLKHGDLSLKLTKVKLSDGGTYRCCVPQLGKATFVDLIVVQPQVIGPSQPVVATVGDDISLPCHLEPAVDASKMLLEWLRSDLDPPFVHAWHDGIELKDKIHLSYKGRTSLIIEDVKHGDISLKLSKVTQADEGRYRCLIPTHSRDSIVELTVDGSHINTYWLVGVSAVALVSLGIIALQVQRSTRRRPCTCFAS